MKTLSSAYPALEVRLKDLHPYDVPEILMINIEKGLNIYLDWLQGNIKV